MSIVGNYAGDLQAPITLALAGTTAVTLGDIAQNRSLFVAAISFANDTAGAITCYIYRYNATATVPANELIWVGSVAADSTEIADNTPIRLELGDYIQVKGAAGVSASMFLLTNFALSR